MVRKCKTCAWWSHDGNPNNLPFCHYDSVPLHIKPDWWCRHWSSTTGWESKGPRDTPDVDEIKAEWFEQALNLLSSGPKDKSCFPSNTWCQDRDAFLKRFE